MLYMLYKNDCFVYSSIRCQWKFCPHGWCACFVSFTLHLLYFFVIKVLSSWLICRRILVALLRTDICCMTDIFWWWVPCKSVHACIMWRLKTYLLLSLLHATRPLHRLVFLQLMYCYFTRSCLEDQDWFTMPQTARNVHLCAYSVAKENQRTTMR